MKKFVTHYILPVILFTVLISTNSIAQPIEKDNKGTDFWLTFMPNYHRNIQIPVANLRDSLSIFIVAGEPTKGVIYYRDSVGALSQKNFQINDISKIYTFGIPWVNYELSGFNNSGEIVAENQDETPAKQHFHITSEKDISVYALNQAETTSEAFMVLPTDALGKDYYVMSYNSDGSQNFGGVVSSTPSQFAIVATEDGTTVTVTPSAATHSNGLASETFLLEKGESYLVQARITSNNLNADLTGSHITSDKPIAVFGGHQRATVPIYEKDTLISRDCLIEQIPPVGTWGKNAFLTPYPLPLDATKVGSDLYRVLAAYDSTVIYINGIRQSTLTPGGFYEGNLDVPATVTSNKPIMVAHFKKTAGDGFNFVNTGLSDPFMLIIPPKEQFQNFYRFINVQAYDFDNPLGVYVEQYVSVVAPNSTLSTVKLDSMPVNVSKFKPIPGSNYSYAWLGGANGADSVTDGAHTIQADEPIAIYVYGYGAANSYGYVGGTAYRIFDFNAPNITSTLNCYRTEGIVFDTLTGDTHILEVTAPADSMINTSVTIPAFSPVQPSVNFTAQLNDVYNDGSFVIHARDSVEYLSRKLIEIPGFTVGITQQKGADSLAHIKRIGPVGKQYCFPVELYNYGKFPQELTILEFSKGTTAFTVDTVQPIVLKPKERKLITVCFQSDVEGDFTDTLIIGQSCSRRALVEYVMSAIVDRNKPAFVSENDSCMTSYRITISDTLPSDLGLLSTEIVQDSLVNCFAVGDTIPSSRVTGYTVTVLDLYQDARYTIRAVDSAGNSSSRTENIPGFTLQIESVNDSIPFTYNNSIIGIVRCDSMSLYNYGSFPLTITEAMLRQNIIFSIPQSQFPFVIPPKERKQLFVCYSPISAHLEPDTDTLQFRFGCLSKYVALQGTNTQYGEIAASATVCGIPIKIEILNIPTFAFLHQNTPNPLPIGGETTIRFGLTNQSPTSLEVYDLLGNKRAVLAQGVFDSGVYDVAISNPDLKPGVYVYRLHYGIEAISKIMVISE